MRKYVLFDLDGTLTDPGVGITKSVAHALRAFGIEVKDLADLYGYIGPPLTDSFTRYHGLSPEDAVRAVGIYREYFSVTGKFENTVYPGIPEMFSALQKAGAVLGVASSKPRVFVEEILEHFDLKKYFAVVVGSELDGRRIRKDEVIREAMEQLGAEPADTVMVGDRSFDAEGAAANGIPCVGAAFGYGGREELLAAGAAAVADDAAELGRILLSL